MGTRISYQSDSPVALSVVHSDGRLRNFEAGTWETPGAVPSPRQLAPFARMGPALFGSIQWAEVPGTDGIDLADEARAYGCFRFDGHSCYTATFPAPVNADRVFTYCAWMKRRGPMTPNATILGAGSGASANPLIRLMADQATGERLALAARDGAGAAFVVDGLRVVDESWHHVAVVGRGAMIDLLLDGAAEAVLPAAALGPIVLDRLSFGALVRDRAGMYWRGDLDDVRGYARPLQAAEIEAAARRWLAGPTGGGDLSVAIWALDAGGVPASLLELHPLGWYSAAQPMPGGAP